MAIYTYVIDHGEDSPPVSAGEVDIRGQLEAVCFYDAIKRLERTEELLETISCESNDYIRELINEYYKSECASL